MPKRLVINLVGRICFVTKGEDIWAVFMNAGHNRALHLRDHAPLLSAPLSMIDSQKVADEAQMTSATFVTQLNRKKQLVDSMGIWSLAGYDMTLGGVAAGAGKVDLEEVADLNAIVATVDPKAKFERGILDPNPTRFGILSRLRLPRSADLTAVTEDLVEKVFLPGGHKQKVATYVRCEVRFANDLVGPSLRLRAFRGGRRTSYKFDGEEYAEVTLMMSNLCNCIKEPPRTSAGTKIDDDEFGLYYQLLKKPRPKQKPLPHLPKTKGTKGAIEIPVCYDPARMGF